MEGRTSIAPQPSRALADLGNLNFKLTVTRDFPGSPVVKTLPSNAGGMGSIPGWGDKIHYALQPQTQNIKEKQYGYKFNKYFKMFYIKKKKKTT